MNKNLHRIIFNPALSLLALGALVLQLPLYAQIKADPGAPGNQRPTILQTANGVTQVNIQTPSAAGVSRNTYSQFDVGSRGAILNNSRTNTNTQIGGMVAANPWIATPARVILNEVNASNPSYLKGPVEVAGQRAEVIIANPSGIQVNGGTFLNASGVTLTTGTPVMNNGNLESFRVQKGMVNVEGLGLDASTADSTRILARAVEVNAGLWARNVTLVTGANDVKALASGADATATKIAGTGAAPAFMLDVAAIGGMYAGHIHLVGTEAGLGVNNRGIISAQQGNWVLRADGWLVNTGKLQAKGDLSVNTTGAISNTGPDAVISSQGNAALTAGTTFANTDGATLAATGTLDVLSRGALTNTGSTIAANGAVRLTAADIDNTAGYLGTAGNLTVMVTPVAGQITNTAGGQMVSEADLSLTAHNVNNQGGKVQALGNLSVTAATLNNAASTIEANGNLTLNATGALNNTGGTLRAGQNLTVQDVGTTRTLAITNTGGTAQSGANNTLTAKSLTGNGAVQAAGNLAIDLQSDFESTTDLAAGGNASVTTTGSFTNRARLSAGQTATAMAANVINTAVGEIAGEAGTTVTATSDLTNRGLIDGGKTRVNAATLTNTGTGRIYGDHVAIAVATLTNDTETLNSVRADAVIAARERLDIGVGTLTNREHALIFSAGTGADALNIGGALDVNDHAIGSVTTVNNNSATIESLGGLNIATAQLNNTNEHFSSGLQIVKGPESLKYIQPEGSSTKVLASNFVWENWSRAGQYRYNTSPPINSSGVLGVSPVPRVGEQSCTGDEPNEVCTRLPGADYLASNSAWSYFSLTPPAAEPATPTLAPPVAPAAAGASSCTAGPGYNASACAAYNAALTQYNTDSSAYDAAWASYTTARAAWQTDTDSRYTALDDRIEAYNAGFAGAVVRSWTEFNVVRTESESKVRTSDPAQILSGGAMRLTGGNLVNDKSRIIAGGALTGDLANLRNVQAEGQHVVNEAGTSESTWSRWRGGFKRYHQRDWGGQVGYYPADIVTTFDLEVAEKRDHTRPTGTGTRVATQAEAGAVAGPQSIALPLSGGAGVTGLPSNSLFRQNPAITAGYLIETDPRFTNYRQWLGGDYMLTAMSFDPATVQKRLGDGFYEQKLVREQVAQLTGRRFLDGYASDEAQYRALMDSGVTLAQAWNLIPGVGLTAAQVARLTSDIVWLVAGEVTLADGSRQTVLTPQVYLRPRAGDLAPTGTLIAGQRIDLNLSGDLTNAGTLAGRTVVNINARNLDNIGGQINARVVAATATQDINIIGGRVTAQDALQVNAGRDLNIQSTSQSGRNTSGASSFSRTTVDRVAGLYVTGDTGTLVASAARDATLIAGVISNSGSGATAVTATRDLNLGTLTTAVQENNVRDTKNYLTGGNSQEVGSQIEGGGKVTLAAGGDLTARAATVNAGGALAVQATGNVTLEAGEESSNYGMGYERKSSGFLSKSSRTLRKAEESTTAIGSSFGGNTVDIQAGRDLGIQGSAVISDRGTTLGAGNNVSIEAEQNTASSSSFSESKKSGVFASGGLGITIGKQQQTGTQTASTTTAAASTVGAISGNVNIVAGQTYAQTGSDVLAPGGNINIAARNVDITEARETSSTTTEQRFKQSGLTLQLTNPILNAAQTIGNVAQAASVAGDARSQALAAATTALAAKNVYDAVSANPGSAGGVNLSLGIGSSKSQSTTTQTTDTSRGSTVAAGGNVNILADGAGTASDILARGSNVSAGNNATLTAEGDIALQAAKNQASLSGSNKSSSASIGLSLGTSGLGITASGSAGRGNQAGDDVTHTNTQISAGNTATVQSGGDTSLRGAVVSADSVRANVGGNLSVESLQDTSTYASKQQSVGASATIGAGASGSISFNKSNANSDYASVTEQSGIKAGDGGFDVAVAGNTGLQGGVISSTQAASQSGNNSLITGTLTTSDILNSASFKASNVGIGVGYSTGSQTVGKGADGSATTGAGQVPGLTLPVSQQGFSATPPIALSASGTASSTTRSGISQAGVTITDQAGQQRATGKTGAQTVAAINTDVATGRDTANALGRIFDEQKVQAQSAVTQAFIQEMGTFIQNRANEADGKRKTAEEAERSAQDGANGLTDAQRLALLDNAATLRNEAQGIVNDWGPGGTYRQIATALAAGAGGNVAGGVGSLVRDTLVNYVQQQGSGYIGQLVVSGAVREGSAEHAALHAILACAGATASSQSCASGAAGAAAASLLTNLYGDAGPNETQAHKEARRNLLTTLVTGLAAAAGGDATAANNAASATTDNNWLASQQIVQRDKELAAAATAADKLKVLGKWAYVSGKQDALTTGGVVQGLAESGWNDIKGLAQFLSDPVAGLNGLKQLISDPNARQAMGDAVFKELDDKIARIQVALEVGGEQNAQQLGQDLGALIWQVGSVATGVGGVAKGGVALAKAGVTVGNQALDAMRDLAKFSAASGRTTGTVWDAITATQPLWPGTQIPRSFELATASGRVWIHGNATEHMFEYASSMSNKGVSSEMVALATQQQIRSLQAAIDSLAKEGIPFGKSISIGGWELRFEPPRNPGQLPALIHALPQ